MLKCLNSALAFLLCMGIFTPVQADVAKGEKLYRQCQGCHSIGPDAPNGFGPHLNGVFERGPGGVDAFDYSPTFDKAVLQGMRWTDATMDEFLKSPRNYIPDTRMAFPGVKNSEDRKEIIAYLKLIGVDGELPETEKIKARRKRLEPRQLASEAEIPTHGVLHLGRPALPEEIIAWDIDIRPDGTGLPEGSGSVEHGTDVYDTGCAACHGIFGEGLGRWPVLAGGHGTLTDERPEKTIGSYWPYLSTVFDYVRRAMPFGNARSLSDDDVYAVTAYLLYLNDQVDEDFVLTSENFNTIRLPNEDNFIADDRLSEAETSVTGEPCMSDCFDEPAVVTQRARILDVTPDKDSDEDSSTTID